MTIAAKAPRGGIVAQLDGKSRPLLLRNGEIERFEEHHGLGIFDFLDQLLGRGTGPQARQIRDIVALGLIGGGLPDRAADQILAELPPSENHRLRQIAHDLVLVAFMADRETQKKSDGQRDGSPAEETTGPEDGTSESGSETSPEPD